MDLHGINILNFEFNTYFLKYVLPVFIQYKKTNTLYEIVFNPKNDFLFYLGTYSMSR